LTGKSDLQPSPVSGSQNMFVHVHVYSQFTPNFKKLYHVSQIMHTLFVRY